MQRRQAGDEVGGTPAARRRPRTAVEAGTASREHPDLHPARGWRGPVDDSAGPFLLPLRNPVAMVSAPRAVVSTRMKDSALRLLLRVFAALPFRAAQALGAAIGGLLWLIPNRIKRVSAENIERCYADRERDWKRRLLRRNLVETGRTLAETAWILRRSAAESLPLVKETTGESAVDEAVQSGRGILFATPHICAWDLLAAYLSQRMPITVLFRPPRLAVMSDLLHGARERLGMKPVPTDAGGVRSLFRALKDGEAVGILPDQRPRGGHGVMAPFFGQPALTMTLFSRLAHRGNASVIFAAMERLPRGRGYRLHFWHADEQVGDPDPTIAATALNREVERAIERAPAQYMWSYERFRELRGKKSR